MNLTSQTVRREQVIENTLKHLKFDFGQSCDGQEKVETKLFLFPKWGVYLAGHKTYINRIPEKI